MPMTTAEFRARRLELLRRDGLDEKTRKDLPYEKAHEYGRRAYEQLYREERHETAREEKTSAP